MVCIELGQKKIILVQHIDAREDLRGRLRKKDAVTLHRSRSDRVDVRLPFLLYGIIRFTMIHQ